jgi:hypothetical protein
MATNDVGAAVFLKKPLKQKDRLKAVSPSPNDGGDYLRDVRDGLTRRPISREAEACEVGLIVTVSVHLSCYRAATY